MYSEKKGTTYASKAAVSQVRSGAEVREIYAVAASWPRQGVAARTEPR